MNELIEKIYNDLNEKFQFEYNNISLYQLMPNYDYDNDYSSLGVYTPAELLVTQKLDILCDINLITYNLKNHLNELVLNYQEAKKAIYHDKSLDNNKYNILKAYMLEYEDEFIKYGLPINLSLNDICELCTLNNMRENDTTNKLFKKYCDAENNKFANTKLSEYIHFKDFGKYSDYSINEFLSVYKLYIMYKNNEIDKSIFDYLLLSFDKLVKVNRALDNNPDLIYTSLKYVKETNETLFAKYNLPIVMDLNKLLNHYDKNNSLQKKKVY